jgi:hypothetical protein
VQRPGRRTQPAAHVGGRRQFGIGGRVVGRCDGGARGGHGDGPGVPRPRHQCLRHPAHRRRPVELQLEHAAQRRHVREVRGGERGADLDVGLRSRLQAPEQLEDRRLAVEQRGVALLRAADARRQRLARPPGIADRARRPAHLAPGGVLRAERRALGQRLAQPVAEVGPRRGIEQTDAVAHQHGLPGPGRVRRQRHERELPASRRPAHQPLDDQDRARRRAPVAGERKRHHRRHAHPVDLRATRTAPALARQVARQGRRGEPRPIGPGRIPAARAHADDSDRCSRNQ